MIFHLSIEADHPAHVAEIIAELWGGEAMPFPPVAEGSWIAFAGDARGSAVEIYPRGTDLLVGEGDADAYGKQGPTRHYGATHMAIATPLDIPAILAIADREGWPAKYRRRDGVFGVIELWIEGCQTVELLTPEMQTEYRAAMTIASWKRGLAAGVMERSEAVAA